MIGRLPDDVAGPAWQALMALVPDAAPSGLGLAALEAAAQALLAQVQWGQVAVGADWEAAEVQGGRWLFREGCMVSLQGSPGQPRNLVLAGADGPSFAVNWATDGSWVAGRPGGETWAGLPSGAVMTEDEVADRCAQGLEDLEERARQAEEAPLAEAVPVGEAGPARLWGDTDQEEAAWTGDMVAPGLSVSGLASLVAGLAGQVAGRALRAARTQGAAPTGQAPRPTRPAPHLTPRPTAGPPRTAEAPPSAPAIAAGPPGQAAVAPAPAPGVPSRGPVVAPPAPAPPAPPAVAVCACGASLVPGARFCARCGAPARAAAAGPTCSRCGNVSVLGARFCKGCGAALGVPTCAHCLAPLSAGMRFCKKCGSPTRPGPKT